MSQIDHMKNEMDIFENEQNEILEDNCIMTPDDYEDQLLQNSSDKGSMSSQSINFMETSKRFEPKIRDQSDPANYSLAYVNCLTVQ